MVVLRANDAFPSDWETFVLRANDKMCLSPALNIIPPTLPWDRTKHLGMTTVMPHLKRSGRRCLEGNLMRKDAGLGL